MATLNDLILSSENIASIKGTKTHGKSDAVVKPFGTLYYNNKTIIYDEASGIIEIRMLMGTRTEKAYSGFHAVRIAFYGAVGKVYESLEDLYWDKVAPLKELVGDDWDTKGEIKTLKKEVRTQDRRGKTTTQKRNFPDMGSDTINIDHLAEINANLHGALLPVANTSSKDMGSTYGATSKIFYLEQPLTGDMPCRVSCSCSDYYYRVGWYNFEEGAHLGARPAPYPKKNGLSITRENMYKVPGLCKHLMMFAVLLMNGGILNALGSEEFNDLRREIIMNRPEKLKVPKKIASEETLEKMFRQLSNNLRKTQVDRNIQAGFKGTYIQGYNKFRQQIYRKNTDAIQAGTWAGSVTQGSSKVAYDTQAGKEWGKQLQSGMTWDQYKSKMLGLGRNRRKK